MKVSIVIPVLNQIAFLKECLESIEATVPDGMDVTVRIIDSASTEPIKALALSGVLKKAWCVYSRLEKNFGVTIPWNVGLSHAMDAGADVICISNSDVVYGPKVIEHCALVAAERGACFPRSIQGGPKPKDFDQQAAERAKRPVMDSLVDTGGFAGWCFWLSRTTVEKIGVFDEQFQLWFSDTDYHWRLLAAGLPPLQVEAALLHHYESRTIVSLPGQFQHQGWIAQDTDLFDRKYKRGKYANATV